MHVWLPCWLHLNAFKCSRVNDSEPWLYVCASIDIQICEVCEVHGCNPSIRLFAALPAYKAVKMLQNVTFKCWDHNILRRSKAITFTFIRSFTHCRLNIICIDIWFLSPDHHHHCSLCYFPSFKCAVSFFLLQNNNFVIVNHLTFSCSYKHNSPQHDESDYKRQTAF